MKRKKTRLEIYQQTYLTKTDIMKLFVVSQPAAVRIYSLADSVDRTELGEFRIEPFKVRFKSAMKVTHTEPSLLLKQIKAEN